MPKTMSRAYIAAMKDKAYLAFRHMVFNTDWYEDKEKFRRAAWCSMHPTIYETGIAIGGFKVPEGLTLNVAEGKIAQLMDDGPNGGKIVEVIRYAGENPEWKGITFCEDAGPCWIVKSLGDPFEVEVTRSTGKVETHVFDTIPYPDVLMDIYQPDEPEV